MAALRWMDRWIDPGLLLIAALTGPLLLLETMTLSPGDERLVWGGEWAIWTAFVANLLIRVVIAVDRARQARELVWDLGMIVGQPVLLLADPVGGVGVAGLVIVAIRCLSRGAVIRRLWLALRQDPLRLLGCVAPLIWITSSSLLLRAERGGGAVDSIGDAMWWGAATLTTVGYGDVSPATGIGRVVAVLTMFSGIGMFSIVTAKFAEYLVTRRATGHGGAVRTAGHTLVLGWSPRVFTVVSELLLAHNGRDRHALVVLAEKDRGAMTREILDHLPDLARSNVSLHCRTGSPSDPAHLAIARPDLARSVIVIGDDEPSDASIVRVLLGLLGRTEMGAAPVVAEITDAATAGALLAAFGDRLTLIESDTFISRLTAQSCRVPGVALAYEELLTFQGP